jgi:hypothetical protein
MAEYSPDRWNDRVVARIAAPAIFAALLFSSLAGGQTTAIYSQPQFTVPTAQHATYQQAPTDSGAKYRAFSLNQLDPATAERQLTQFFAAVPGVEIVADVPRNRLLVRADENALRQAGEFLTKIDPPVAAPTAAPTAPQLPAQQLEAYPLTPTSQAILSALEKQAAGRPDIRVAVGPAVVADLGARAEFDSRAGA